MKQRTRRKPSSPRGRRRRQRLGNVESLESRLMLNADWENPGQSLDVNNDRLVSPFDALAGINRLNAAGAGPFGERAPDSTEPYYDANGDELHTPFDVLVVINAINANLLLVSAQLEHDSAANGVNQDRLTNEATTLVTVATGGQATLRAGFGETAVEDFVDVPLAAGGQFRLDETLLASLNGEPLADGTHRLRLLAADGTRTAQPLDFEFTLDRVAPTATVQLPDTVRTTLDSFDIVFDEAIDAGVFSPTSFRLEIVGGPQDGQSVPIESVEPVDGFVARVHLKSPLADEVFQLDPTVPVTDPAGNPVATGSTSKQFTVIDPVSIRDVSPSAGETMVNVTRETTIRFDDRIDPATLTPASFRVIANGAPVPGRIVVSSTERFATYFYDDPLPASTEVQIVIDGTQIRGRDGLLLDADGDLEPGGVLKTDFRTLPLTRIAGTNVFGYVRDSLSGNPIAGATIRVDAFPAANVVTDSDGRFELEDLPAPEVFVHVDGSTATNAPAGFVYPNVGKPFHTVPGQTVQLSMDGAPMDIFLPPVAMADVQPLSDATDTDVGFGDVGEAELVRMFPELDSQMFERMAVTFAAGSAVNEQGVPATEAVIVPVPPDRIPGRLPANLNPSLVISIQAAGATNFDVPAPITFPNLEGLPPGEKTLIFSFDHDAGRWTVVGTGRVSEDGMAVVSEGGVIRAPGWHLTVPGTELDPEIVDDPSEPTGELDILTVSQRVTLADFVGSATPGAGEGLSNVAFSDDGTMSVQVTVVVPGDATSEPADISLNFDNAGADQFPFNDAEVVQIDGVDIPPVPISFRGKVTLEDFPGGKHQITIQGVGVPDVARYERVTVRLEQGKHEAEFTTALVADQRPPASLDTFFLDDGSGSSVPITSYRELANHFRPIMHFDRDPNCTSQQSCAVEERFMPTSVDATIDAVINGGDLRLDTPVSSPDNVTREDVGRYADYNGAIDLEGNNDPARFRLLTAADPKPPTIYSSVKWDQANQIAIHYWFHYSFSNWAEEGGHNDHEGDWENITVFLRRPSASEAFAPIAVGYSQHLKGEVVTWANAVGTMPGAVNPHVFVARGAHASYPFPGSHSILTPSGYKDDVHRGGIRWATDDYDLSVLEYQRFASNEYAMVENNVDQGFTQRADWVFYPGLWGEKNGLGTSGPRGPMYLEYRVSKPVSRYFDAWSWGMSLDNGELLNPNPGQPQGAGEDALDVFAVSSPSNFGGVRSGSTHAELLTIQNISGTGQNIVGLEVNSAASADFSLELGVPVTPGEPLTLSPGESISVPISFHPAATGLRRGLLELRTDDPTDDTVQLRLVGTGVPANGVTSPAWGDDYVALIMPDNGALPVMRLRSNLVGGFDAQIPGDSFLQYQVFDPATGLIGTRTLTAAATGETTHLPAPGFAASVAPDSDGDGLPDDIEFTIGTRLDRADSDDDGVDDFAELENGLNPLDGIAFPVGVIAGVNLAGQAKEVIVEQPLTGSGQTAFVATGSHGLAVVDVSQFDNPIVLGQLDLPGDATDVAVDLGRNIAVVAANAGGLHLVDVTDPMMPALLQTIAMEVAHVEIIGETAYAGNGSSLRAIDLQSGELLGSLTFGESALTGLAREGTNLYTMDGNNFLTVVDVSELQMVRRGSLQLAHGGGRLFVGGQVAYVTAGSNSRGGYSTVDVSDADLPVLISGSDVESPLIAPRTDVIANGSGLALLVGTTGGVDALDVMDAGNPSETNEFLSRSLLPTAPFSVTAGAGIAFVAAGTGGLQVVNYMPFDTLGQSPSVSIAAGIEDLDGATAGVQALEGLSVPIRVTATDDVQVRSLELLIDGQVVATDVSFPYDFLVPMPPIAGPPEVLEVRVRATDTGGNSRLSAPLTLSSVADTFPPELVQITPGDASRRLEGHQSIRVAFSEPMDEATLTAANIQVARADAPNAPLAPQQVQIRRGGRELGLILPPLAIGDYVVTVKTTAVTDVAGNSLVGPDVVSTFTIIENRDPGDTIATALDLGILDGPIVFQDQIGDDSGGNPDPADVITFQLTRAAAVSMLISGIGQTVSLELYHDLDDNGQLGFFERLDSQNFYTSSQVADFTDLPPGTYHLLIERNFGTAQTDYLLTLTPELLPISDGPEAGATIATARDLGELDAPVAIADILGGPDAGDVYTFQLAQARTVMAQFSGLTDSLRAELYSDLDGDGQFDSAERLNTDSGTQFGLPFTLADDLPPGTYQLRVTPSSDTSNTRYALHLSTTDLPITDPADPGDTIGTARDVGVLSATHRVTDVVGGPDKGDVLSFTLDQAANVVAEFTEISDPLRAQLYHDGDGDGQFDSGEQLNTGTSANGTITLDDDLPPGTYLLRILPTISYANSQYALQLTASALPVSDPVDPGQSIATARDVGVLTTEYSADDVVGGPDEGDVFTIHLNQATAVEAQFSGFTDFLRVDLYSDVNGDGLFEYTEDLNGDTGSSSSSSFTLVDDLPPGTYHYHVNATNSSANSRYRVVLTPTEISVTDPADPGADVATARDLGVLDATQTISDIVGGRDLGDVFTFHLTQAALVNAQFSNLNDTLRVTLYSDTDGNGQLEFDEDLDYDFGTASSTVELTNDLPPGTYHLQVEPGNNSSNTRYSFELATTSIPVTDPVDPGDTIATARDLGELSSPQTIVDVIGGEDSGDVFAFQLSQATAVTTLVSDVNDSLRVELYNDQDANGQFDSREVLRRSFASSSAPTVEVLDDLPPGDYFIRVYPSHDSANSRYRMEFSTAALAITDPADPGDTIATARSLGTLGTTQSLMDVLGGPDPGDVFTFQVDQAVTLTGEVSGVTDTLNIALYHDDDADGQFDSNERLNYDTVFDSPETLTDDLSPGTYHLYLRPSASDSHTRYTVQLSTAAIGVTDPLDPGDTIATARDLGTLAAPQTVVDVVGGGDEADVYKFQLTQPAAFAADFSRLHEGLRAELYRDDDADGQFDSGERLTSRVSGSEFTLTDDVDAGTYFLRVSPSSTTQNTSYQLQLSRVLALRAPVVADHPWSVASLSVAAAQATWDAAVDLYVGLGVERTRFDDVFLKVVDLPGNMLGAASRNTVYLDINAARHGWFVDPTPTRDEAFYQGRSDNHLVAERDSLAADRMDLLTVVLHELGHVLDLPHVGTNADGGNELMAETLTAGTRHKLSPAAFAAAVDQLFAK